jgi:hypothetical protein
MAIPPTGMAIPMDMATQATGTVTPFMAPSVSTTGMGGTAGTTVIGVMAVGVMAVGTMGVMAVGVMAVGVMAAGVMAAGVMVGICTERYV